jgi:hypothetical protein
MRKRSTLIALTACAALAAGCGDEASDQGSASSSTRESNEVSLAQRHAQLEKDPYALRCSDIRDKVASADITRRVQYALADDARIRGLTRLQSSQSIFYAITELCKAKPGSYQPSNDAIAAVRSGELRADLGTP